MDNGKYDPAAVYCCIDTIMYMPIIVRLTHAFSFTLWMRGAYGDSGMLDLPLRDGEPKPDMPETLYLLPLEAGGRMVRDGLLWC
jgi:hypothetical protein